MALCLALLSSKHKVLRATSPLYHDIRRNMQQRALLDTHALASKDISPLIYHTVNEHQISKPALGAGFMEEMNEAIHNNLPFRVRNKILNWGALPDEAQKQYEQLAERHDGNLVLPPADEDILANHKHIEGDIRNFLDNMLSTDGHCKHGNGVMLVLGAFNHGLERQNVCVVGVNGQREADFIVPKEAWNPLLSAMRDYLDLHRPQVAVDETSLDAATMPSPLDTTAAKAASPPSPAPSSLSLSTTPPLLPSSANPGTLAFSTNAAVLDIPPADVAPPTTSGSGLLAPEVIMAALLVLYPHAAVIGFEESFYHEQNSMSREDFAMTDGTGNVNDEEPSSKVSVATTKRPATVANSNVRPASAFAATILNVNSPLHGNLMATNTTEVRRSSARFGDNYTHRVIKRIRKYT
ncbi:hypothetical protein BDN72DRAFT_904169 [Pluteus cervinus]|uniref:Uncharacterized protein n=1 Tax=Pluteus cervinus TaxID=181527 RepID=A0ACD3A6P4_9AGAR|nr:hypothetical protein BDN72DRAFT_904169 [Pluteus cervinus]